MARTFIQHTFGTIPEMAFHPGGVLDGATEAGPEAYDLPEVQALARSDEEVVYELWDGRLAVVGMTVEGHPFWVEAIPVEIARDSHCQRRGEAASYWRTGIARRFRHTRDGAEEASVSWPSGRSSWVAVADLEPVSAAEAQRRALDAAGGLMGRV